MRECNWLNCQTHDGVYQVCKTSDLCCCTNIVSSIFLFKHTVITVDYAEYIFYDSSKPLVAKHTSCAHNSATTIVIVIGLEYTLVGHCIAGCTGKNAFKNPLPVLKIVIIACSDPLHINN